MNSMDTEIRFVTNDGQVYKGGLETAKLEAFLNSREGARNKFHSLAGNFIDSKKIDEIADMVFHLEGLRNIADLAARLTLD